MDFLKKPTLAELMITVVIPIGTFLASGLTAKKETGVTYKRYWTGIGSIISVCDLFGKEFRVILTSQLSFVERFLRLP